MKKKEETENTSGWQPVEFKVLVIPDPVEKETESGLIVKPEIAIEKEQAAEIRATYIAKGGRAFEDWGEKEREALVPGKRVLLAKYAGNIITGVDGKKYQFVNDREVVAVAKKTNSR